MSNTSNFLCSDRYHNCLTLAEGNTLKKCTYCPTGFMSIGTGCNYI